MGFLGEVTRLGSETLRPHAIEVATSRGTAGALPGRVARVLRVGFEVRLTVTTPDGSDVLVVLTRTHARSLGLAEGSSVWLAAATGATTMRAMMAV